MRDNDNRILTYSDLVIDYQDSAGSSGTYDAFDGGKILNFYNNLGLFRNSDHIAMTCVRYKNGDGSLFDDELRNGYATFAYGEDGTKDSKNRLCTQLFQARGYANGTVIYPDSKCQGYYCLPSTSTWSENKLIRSSDLYSIGEFVSVKNYYRSFTDGIPFTVNINNAPSSTNIGGALQLYVPTAYPESQDILNCTITSKTISNGVGSSFAKANSDTDLITFNKTISNNKPVDQYCELKLDWNVASCAWHVLHNTSSVTITMNGKDITMSGRKSGTLLIFESDASNDIYLKDLSKIEKISVNITLKTEISSSISWSDGVVARSYTNVKYTAPYIKGTVSTSFALTASTFTSTASLTGVCKAFVGPIPIIGASGTKKSMEVFTGITCSLSGSTLTFKIPTSNAILSYPGQYLFGCEYSVTHASGVVFTSYIYFPVNVTSSGGVTRNTSMFSNELFLDLNIYTWNGSVPSGTKNCYVATKAATISPWINLDLNDAKLALTQGDTAFNVSDPKISTSIFQKATGSYVYLGTNTTACTQYTAGNSTTYLVALLSGCASFAQFTQSICYNNTNITIK